MLAGFAYFLSALWSFLIPLIQRDLGFSFVLIGSISSFSLLFSLVFKVFLGYFSDVLNKKLVFLVCLILFFAASFLVVFFESPVFFLVASVCYYVAFDVVYWVCLLSNDNSKRVISRWFILNNFAFLSGLLFAEFFVFFVHARFVFLFLMPLFAFYLLRLKGFRGERLVVGRVKPRLPFRVVLASLGAFFMMFQTNLWAFFFPIFLETSLPSFGAFLSTGLFLIVNTAFFIVSFWVSGRFRVVLRSALLVSVTTFLFSLFVFSIPLLPVLVFVFLFFSFKNLIVSFRMVGVSEMMLDVTDNGSKGFQTLFYSSVATLGGVVATFFGGVVSDLFGLNAAFFLSLPFGLLSALVFLGLHHFLRKRIVF